MSGKPWYAFYPDKYARETAHLTFVQDAAYRRMLDNYYQREKALPPKVDDVHRVARASTREEKQAVSTVLAEFFKLKDDGWHNEKADEELLKAAAVSAKRSHAANKRHCKTDANAHAIADNLQPVCDAIAHTSTLTETGLEPDGSKPKARERAPAPLPTGVAQQLWQDFRDHRRRLRAPMTPRAESILLRQIEELREQGHDPTAMIEQSIARGWKGIFAGDGDGKRRKQTATDSHLAGIAELIREGREGVSASESDGDQGEG